MSIFYYLPALIGIVFIIVGTYHGWKLRRLVGRCKAAATGTLLGFEQQKSKSGDRYFPVVEFSDGEQTYRARHGFGSPEWDIVAGDEVDLRYNPDNPEEIYLYHKQSLRQQYASPFFVIVGGLIFIFAYYYLL